MSQGYSFVSFGAIAKVSEFTLHDWVKRIPEFAEAKGLAETLSLYHWETQGIEGLTAKGFNATVWIYTMKCRFRKFGYNEDAPSEEDDLSKVATDRLLQIVKNGKGS